MIDNFSILFSTIMMMYVIWHAAKLNRTRPWFETKSFYDQAEPREAAARAAAAAKRKPGGNGKPRVPIELLTHGPANRR